MTSKDRNLTQKQLHDVIIYDNGILTWKKSNKQIVNIRILVNGCQYRNSHLVWLYVTGNLPLYSMKFKDGDETNINYDNLLQEPSINEQKKNSPKVVKAKSGYKGVTLHKHSGLFRAYRWVNSKHIVLGYYKTPEEANHALVNDIAKPIRTSSSGYKYIYRSKYNTYYGQRTIKGKTYTTSRYGTLDEAKGKLMELIGNHE